MAKKPGLTKAGASQRGGPVMPFLPAISAGVSILSGVKSLFAKAPKGESAPEVSAPTVMPTEDSALVLDAKRRSLAAQVARGGRDSTILTDSDFFGGGK